VKPAPVAPKTEQRPPVASAPVLTLITGGNGEPAEPDWGQHYDDDLDVALAREQWRTTLSELRGTEKLAPANAHQIKRYVMWCVQYEVAARHVAEDGAVFPRKGKKQPAYNPWFTVMKAASEQCASLEAELTITPRRRNNGGKVPKKAKRVAASDEFL
jgi:P27 family predicted phage terminase small subunit